MLIGVLAAFARSQCAIHHVTEMFSGGRRGFFESVVSGSVLGGSGLRNG
jgi:hypothetical protein